jgi:ADP-ribose pyrophosphatase YjhB (NUDIX family)
MGRRDYLNDPDAPPANSLVPAASVVVVDDQGRILLHRRTDNDMWALPGGAMDIGETIADCARREVLEETGLTVDVQSIVGLYTDPGHVFAYDDGEVRQEFSICFHARVSGGTIQASEESHEVRFFKPDEIDDLPMIESIRLRITDYLKRDEPAIR